MNNRRYSTEKKEMQSFSAGSGRKGAMGRLRFTSPARSTFNKLMPDTKFQNKQAVERKIITEMIQVGNPKLFFLARNCLAPTCAKEAGEVFERSVGHEELSLLVNRNFITFSAWFSKCRNLAGMVRGYFKFDVTVRLFNYFSITSNSLVIRNPR